MAYISLELVFLQCMSPVVQSLTLLYLSQIYSFQGPDLQSPYSRQLIHLSIRNYATIQVLTQYRVPD